jgi:hypothetical protein
MNDETPDESNSDGFMDRIKESPRTVSALIIILIVAAAIYAFSGEPTQPGQELANTDQAAITDERGATDESGNDGQETMVGDETDGNETTTITPPATSVEPIEKNQLQDMSRDLPVAERAGAAYVEKALAGDGITHLARRSTTRWLAENNAGYQITNEHRIYIEDYIQNKIGSDGLSIGEARTISFELISEVVKAAGELNDQQLRNLSHYTTALN